MTDVNDNGHWYLCLGGFEIYGTVKQATKEFIYQFDFDKNGLIYAIGTNFGKEKEWKNPSQSDHIIVKPYSSMAYDSKPKHELFGRIGARCILKQQSSSWFSINLQKYKIRPTHYTLRHYASWDVK